MKRAAVILAGGAGTRLRPLSSDDRPKQFLRLWSGRSLVQMTWDRLARLLPPEAIFVSTNDRYRALCVEHLPSLPPGNVIAEPARRNTAPAIALSTFFVEERLGDCCVAFLPSDHFIADEAEFVRVLDRAFSFAEESSELMTIGIAPTEPNTGFGYLELGAPLAPGIERVVRFTEKPSRELAEQFLKSGKYAWNGGIFVWRTDAFRREIAAATPELLRVSEAYDEMPAISIDYALMEKSSRVATIRGDFGWSDVGSFEALAKAGAEIPPELIPR